MEYLTQEVMPYVVKLVPLLINGMKITIFVSILAFAISIVMGSNFGNNSTLSCCNLRPHC